MSTNCFEFVIHVIINIYRIYQWHLLIQHPVPSESSHNIEALLAQIKKNC